MLEIHLASLGIGIIVGIIIGIAISFVATYLVDNEYNKNDRFSNGWEAGVKYGRETKEVQDE